LKSGSLRTYVIFDRDENVVDVLSTLYGGKAVELTNPPMRPSAFVYIQLSHCNVYVLIPDFLYFSIKRLIFFTFFVLSVPFLSNSFFPKPLARHIGISSHGLESIDGKVQDSRYCNSIGSVQALADIHRVMERGICWPLALVLLVPFMVVREWSIDPWTQVAKDQDSDVALRIGVCLLSASFSRSL
jgi:hypothetical protein